MHEINAPMLAIVFVCEKNPFVKTKWTDH